MSARHVVIGLLLGLLDIGTLPLAADDKPATHGLVRRVYSVADLVLPLNDAPCVVLPGTKSSQTAPARPSAPVACSADKPRQPPKTQHADLMKLIAQTVCPESWGANGGKGSMDYFPTGMALVVRQSPDVHAQIAALLEELRKLQEVQVSLELRFVSLTDPAFERIGIDFDLSIPCQRSEDEPAAEQPSPARPINFLTDKQKAQLFALIQGDRCATVVQAPKVTLFNGQPATIKLSDTQFYVTNVQVLQSGGQVVHVPKIEPFETGHTLTVLPAVSADRRYVKLHVQFDQTALADSAVPLFPVTSHLTPVFEGGAVGQPIPFTQFLQQPKFKKQSLEQVVVVPDGGSVLLGGLPMMQDVRVEFVPPMLSKIPYVNRLFRHTENSKAESNLLVVVTPRVVISEQEELTAPPRTDAVVAKRKKREYAGLSEVEEQEACCCKQKVASPLDALLKQYHAACAAGNLAEATQLAVQALSLDPACFSKPRSAAPTQR